MTSRCVLINQCDYQCSSKQQSIPMLFVWSLCSSRLFSDPIGRGYPSTTMTHCVYNFMPISHMWYILFLITVSVSFHRDKFEFYQDIHVHGPYSAIYPLKIFHPMDFLSEYWIEHVTVGLLHIKFVFSMRVFYREVPCPASVYPCGPTPCSLFGNIVLNNSRSASLTQRFLLFCILLIHVFTYILIHHNTFIHYLCFPYLLVPGNYILLILLVVCSVYCE